MFEYNLDALIKSVTLVFVFVLAYLVVFGRKRYTNLPPGPKPLPILGNLLDVYFHDAREVGKAYTERYGNIYTFYKYNQPLIVVNGYEHLRDLFVKNGSVFTHRMKNQHLFMFEGEGLTYADGDIWKHNRRFVLRTLKDFGMGKRILQTKLHEEISYFLDAVDEINGQPFDINDLLKNAISNVICSIVFGKRYSYNDKAFKDILALKDITARGNFHAKPMWVKYIPGDPFHVAKAHQSLYDVKRFYKLKIQEHLESYDKNETRDFIDAYIKEMKGCDSNEESQITNEDELTRLLHDVFSAGMDTTTSSLRYALLHLLRNPDIQERIHNELAAAVPDNRFPNVNDKKQLPFLEATIFENLRLSVVISMAGPRSADEDLEYRGYIIPKNVLVVPSVVSVLNDERVWENAHDFNPSRFLQGNKLLTKVDEFIPFSVGSRACPGEALARMSIYLFLGAMIQRFQFLTPEGEGPPKLTRVIGTVDAPKPFKLRAIKRG